ncbi:MAG: bifunctional phosphopantothenoylcysteine decarboxylase/phosphopantothenate--cysteine ligase CoaBC [Candidatus Bathyarchaeia archaeon]
MEISMGHPSKDIIGTKGDELKGKKIVLCITGSVAAIESPKIARELMRHGAEVFTIMSKMAKRIIHPYLMEWATGNPVVLELTGKIEHVSLLNKADLVLIAPATANTINKIACGIDDTPVTSATSVALGLNKPILILPAMHASMYNHPVLIENIEKLEKLGVKFLKPRIEEGKAKIVALEEVLEAVIAMLYEKDMKGLNVLVTAGPTIEHIDPIRILTNKSSGKMGIAIAKEAFRRGAKVTLIYGPGLIQPPHNIKIIHVETSKEIYDKVISELESNEYDIFVSAAAVSDFMLEKPYSYKINTHNVNELKLELKTVPKIVEKVKKISPKTFLIIFKAEYKVSNEELIKSSYDLLKEVNADLVVGNDVARKGVGFRTETNEVVIVESNCNVEYIPLTSKQKIAKRIFDIALKLYKRDRP